MTQVPRASSMNKRVRRLFLITAMLVGTACALPVRSAFAQDMKPHGDHNPHHGGLVLMYGMDLHYEIVLLPAGQVQLWLSDGARDELPAAIISDVVVEIERSSGKREAVDMTVARSGESWEGKASVVKEAGTTLHLAFVFRGEAAVVSFPATALMGSGRERLVQDSAHSTGRGAADGQ